MTEEQKQYAVETFRQQHIEQAKFSSDALQASAKAALEFARLAMNGCLLINGGAAVALMYNAKTLPSFCFDMLGWCGTGALLAALAPGVAYLAQIVYTRFAAKLLAEHLLYSGTALARFIADLPANSTPLPARSPLFGHALTVLSGFLVIGSLLCAGRALHLFIKGI